MTARVAKSKSCLYHDVECVMCCHIHIEFNVFLITLLLCDYHNWTRGYRRILTWFFQCKPTAPTCNGHCKPYVLSGIQSEAPNNSPNVYDITSVFGSRENSQSRNSIWTVEPSWEFNWLIFCQNVTTHDLLTQVLVNLNQLIQTNHYTHLYLLTNSLDLY